MNSQGVTGRTALITGGARGIGRAIAEHLRDAGASVVIGDLEAPEVPGCSGTILDVTSSESVQEAVQFTVEKHSKIDILVLNAGIFLVKPFEDMTLDEWQQSIAVNLTGSYLVCREVLPHMRNSGYGRVVSLGSSAGITGGTKAVAAYAASKAGLMALTKSIAKEYAAHGVTANTLAPALIETKMAKNISDLVDQIPVGRLGQPEEIADLVTFLSSERSGFITGAVIDINGGYLIR